MEEKKNRLNKKVVIFLIAMFVLIYFVSFLLLFDCGHFHFVPKWFWGQAGFAVIIGVGVAWITTMTVLIRKNIKIRITLSLLGLAIVAAVLTWWILENTSISIHIYG